MHAPLFVHLRICCAGTLLLNACMLFVKNVHMLIYPACRKMWMFVSNSPNLFFFFFVGGGGGGGGGGGSVRNESPGSYRLLKVWKSYGILERPFTGRLEKRCGKTGCPLESGNFSADWSHYGRNFASVDKRKCVVWPSWTIPTRTNLQQTAKLFTTKLGSWRTGSVPVESAARQLSMRMRIAIL